MDLGQIARLKDVQESALLETLQKIRQLQEYVEDYNALKLRLESLPDKTVHDVMVPFGNLAFMPGQLVHTNEILLLLGDNWFVTRSAKQSAEIIGRRLADLREKIEELNKQRSLLEPRIAFTDELYSAAESKDVFEITEAYDEEKEKEWKAQHEVNVRKYRKELNECKVAKVNVESDKTAEFQQLWERLEELEKEEGSDESCAASDENRMSIPPIAPYPSAFNTSATAGKDLVHGISKNVRWQDMQSSSVNESDEGSDRETVSIDSGSECQKHVPTITFHHTEISNEKPESSSSDETAIITPGDIHRTCSAPKSILKKSKSTVPVEMVKSSNSIRSVPDQPARSGKPAVNAEGDAVSSVVVERQDPIPASAVHHSSLTSTDEPKRVSRFKASRLLSNTK